MTALESYLEYKEWWLSDMAQYFTENIHEYEDAFKTHMDEMGVYELMELLVSRSDNSKEFL